MPIDNPLPVLYSFRRCPYAMRARLAIAASKQPCQLREVVLRNKPQALLDASPKATVPVLVDQGTVIAESLDIMLWALRRHDPERWLEPSDTAGIGAHADAGADAGIQALRQDMLALIGQSDKVFKHHLDRYKYPQRYDLASGVQDRDAAALWLQDTIEGRLLNGYLFGSTVSLADMAILPFVRQYAHTDKVWFDAQPWPRITAWLEQFLSSARFERVMEKYTPWAEGEQGVLFP